MGFSFKPKKCRSLSVIGGKPSPTVFTLLDHSNPSMPNRVNMKTMESDPHKFLGSILTFRNSAADQFKYLNKLLLEKLENLDSKCAVRGEYKLATYTIYLLPSLRFHLTQ